MAWYRCGMNGTYNATTVSRSGAICNYVANVGGVPLSRFIANITPIQAGSGDPSPINQRPITGWSAVHAYRSGADTTNPDTYTINLGGTYYVGTLNVLTGLLTITAKYLVFNSAEYYGTYGADNAPLFYVDITGEGIKRAENATFDTYIISNMLTKVSTAGTQRMKNNEIRTEANDNPTKIYFRMDAYTNKSEIDAFLANNPLQVVAELVTPVEYQLTPAQITQLLGENNVWADSGNSEVDFFKIIRT